MNNAQKNADQHKISKVNDLSLRHKVFDLIKSCC